MHDTCSLLRALCCATRGKCTFFDVHMCTVPVGDPERIKPRRRIGCPIEVCRAYLSFRSVNVPYFDFLLLFIVAALFILAAGCSSRTDTADKRPRRGDPASRFQQLDANQDGLLSWDEFKAAPARSSPVEELFNKLDADGDGVLTRDEFMSMRQGGPDGEHGQRRMR